MISGLLFFSHLFNLKLKLEACMLLSNFQMTERQFLVSVTTNICTGEEIHLWLWALPRNVFQKHSNFFHRMASSGLNGSINIQI